MATNNTSANVQESVASLYSKLVEKRQNERIEKEEKKLLEKEEKRRKEEEKKLDEDGTKLSKKEQRELELDSWKEVIVGLTGEDLEYSNSKGSKKKKYGKWISDENGESAALIAKPVKKKKKNYAKDFEPEINMLKTIVADQNRFTADLQKRFQIAAGPSTKDAMPINKTIVELAAVLNSSRSNSLGLLSQIGTMKRNVAELYMKQKKLDADTAGAGFGNSQDIGLMGSSVAASIFNTSARNDISPTSPYPYEAPSVPQTTNEYQTEGPQNSSQPERQVVQGTAFDPSTWDSAGIGSGVDVVQFENIPHSIVVEWHRAESKARFKAIRDDNGEELLGCPVPTSDPSKLTFNEVDKTVKGQFDEMYKLEII